MGREVICWRTGGGRYPLLLRHSEALKGEDEAFDLIEMTNNSSCKSSIVNVQHKYMYLGHHQHSLSSCSYICVLGDARIPILLCLLCSKFQDQVHCPRNRRKRGSTSPRHAYSRHFDMYLHSDVRQTENAEMVDINIRPMHVACTILDSFNKGANTAELGPTIIRVTLDPIDCRFPKTFCNHLFVFSSILQSLSQLYSNYIRPQVIAKLKDAFDEPTFY